MLHKFHPWIVHRRLSDHAQEHARCQGFGRPIRAIRSPALEIRGDPRGESSPGDPRLGLVGSLSDQDRAGDGGDIGKTIWKHVKCRLCVENVVESVSTAVYLHVAVSLWVTLDQLP